MKSVQLRFASRGLILLLICVGLSLPASALSAGEAIPGDVADHPNCPICGMDRHKFSHSRVLIDYDDGSQFGACSLHCAAIDMAYHLDKGLVSIQVGDYATRQLIDAQSAVWVVGGNKMGVMTKNAKWAFADPKNAEAFMAENGGRRTDFETAIKGAYTEMYSDTRMIREKRKMKRAKMKKGKKTAHGSGSHN